MEAVEIGAVLVVMIILIEVVLVVVGGGKGRVALGTVEVIHTAVKLLHFYCHR